MAFPPYFSLRKQIYIQEIRHWLKQVENLFLVGSMFLGTALPALFFSILLAYGVIFDKQSSLLQTLILVWSLLLSQSLILILCKSAILGSRFGPYVSSLETSKKQKFISDTLLSIASNPVLLICLFVLLSISVSKWSSVIHGFILLVLLILGTYASIYKSAKMHFALLVTLLCIPVIVNVLSQSFAISLFGLDQYDIGLLLLLSLTLVSLIIQPLMSKVVRPFHIQLPAFINIWMQILIGNRQGKDNTAKPNLLLVVVMVSMLIIMLSVYSHMRLPEFANIVMTISMQFLVLFCACLQLSTNKVLQEHSTFFAQFAHSRSFNFLQFLLPTIIFILLISVLGLLLETFLVVLSVLAFAICMFSAKVRASYLILIWLFSCFVSSLFVYLCT